MTQLSADLARTYELGDQTDLPVKASSPIYVGSAVGLTGGYARQLTAGDPFQGFAINAVASQGSNGDANVHLQTEGNILLTISSVAVTDIGAAVYASDGNTFTLTQSTNSYIGRVRRVHSTNTAVVSFEKDGRGSVTALTDSSGGTAADTIAAIGATYSQTEVRNAVASLTAKVNAILAQSA